MEHDLKVLRQYYDKVLINEYYSTPEIDPDIANKIVSGLILYMNIAEKQQAKIEKCENALREVEKQIEEKTLSFNDEEIEIIRELLSQMSCGYERETFYFDCCDANPIIKKIDDFLKKTK